MGKGGRSSYATNAMSLEGRGRSRGRRREEDDEACRMTLHIKKLKVFLEMGQEGERSKTKRECGRGEIEEVRRKYTRSTKTGHNNNSSCRSPTMSFKERTWKERG